LTNGAGGRKARKKKQTEKVEEQRGVGFSEVGRVGEKEERKKR